MADDKIQAYAETPAELSFGAEDDHFWIKVGPAYREAMVIRIMGNWPRQLHESLSRYLKGESDETHRDPADDE